MRNMIATGDTLTITAPAAVLSGAGVLVGALFGVALADIASGARGAIRVRGVVRLGKAPSQAWTLGQRVYWDAGNSRATNVATGNTMIGLCAEAVAGGAGDVLGNVLLGCVPPNV